MILLSRPIRGVPPTPGRDGALRAVGVSRGRPGPKTNDQRRGREGRSRTLDFGLRLRRTVNPRHPGPCPIHRQPSFLPDVRVTPHMNSTVSLTDLQLAIVRILWERGECTVLEVQEALAPERKLAQTTVATILTRLEKRRIVRHQANGRLFVYKALVTEPQVRRSMVSDLTDLLFDGSPAALITHLLAEKEFDSSDLDEVKKLIADAERGGNGD